ncbi:MAG: site-specific integrase [Mycobacteriaceae bacterium]|nr:site-specific integrase [Mycobacteriaceae bacterium]
MAKRSFGSVRQLQSGRYQARYTGPDGLLHKAPRTFETKKAAQQWLSTTEVQMFQGGWIDPKRSRITVTAYVERWIEQRPRLRPRTRELYRWLLHKHLEADGLGGTPLGKLTTTGIRHWRSARLEAGASELVVAKAYRLLRAALNTAVNEDRILPANPCRVRGADQEDSPERPVLTVQQVFAIAEAMPPRYRIVPLLTAFTSLRWGEVSALQRADIADDASVVRVSKAFSEVKGQGLVVGPPKSRAGRRVVAIPADLRQEVLTHLEKHVKPAARSYLITGVRGRPLRRSNFGKSVDWVKVVANLGMPGIHFHDLRHAGNSWAARSGTTTKDLMNRMGHDDVRAALIYQHASLEEDQRIAGEMSRLIREVRGDGGG